MNAQPLTSEQAIRLRCLELIYGQTVLPDLTPIEASNAAADLAYFVRGEAVAPSNSDQPAPAFNFQDWLDTEVAHQGGTIKCSERTCFLLMANGGWKFNGWVTAPRTDLGHQRGLIMEDALELMQINAFLSGLGKAGINWSATFQPIWEVYKTAHGG